MKKAIEYAIATVMLGGVLGYFLRFVPSAKFNSIALILSLFLVSLWVYLFISNVKTQRAARRDVGSLKALWLENFKVFFGLFLTSFLFLGLFYSCLSWTIPWALNHAVGNSMAKEFRVYGVGKCRNLYIENYAVDISEKSYPLRYKHHLCGFTKEEAEAIFLIGSLTVHGKGSQFGISQERYTWGK